MELPTIIGIDLGATNIRGALVRGQEMSNLYAQPIRRMGSMEEVLDDIFVVVDHLITPAVKGIGIGVPSVVNLEEGIVYDVQFIPSWKEVPLKKLLEARFQIPVFVNNDANCFALGEYYFGKGQGFTHMVGMTLGTGIGAGIIINRHLYAGTNCGAGEFGMVSYLEHNYEYYGSGQYFEHLHQVRGQHAFELASAGDPTALGWYAELGRHLGKVVKLVMYCYDPPLIVLGGSVRNAYPFFQEALWAELNDFAYSRSLAALKLELSTLENSGVLGAAALYLDAQL